ncbi:hypothetical protein [Roseicyclus persicicus]|uniref:LPXTG cell wall anchor domain-containing protein n=1 Tax=Roseicyclus persicicus TaxID=2650661 RepID=A0A7X6H259_9RHOB|nr:hypothetical protein [Roseibacterium persicicum]NKX45979.1 hypothetical protein [Roseibacterium persicicum]
MKKPALFAAAFLAARPALAHPGHDEAATAAHWVSDVSHLAVVAALAALSVIVIGAGLARRRARARRRAE